MIITSRTKQKMGVFFLAMVVAWPLLGVKQAALPELKVPINMAVDQDHVVILDGVTIYVYSRKDFRLLQSFGKRGQGPGELVPDDELPLQMQLIDGEVWVHSQNKMIRFSMAGEVKEEKTLRFLSSQWERFGEGYAMVRIYVTPNHELSLRVGLFNNRLEEVKALSVYQQDADFPRGKIVVPPPYIYLCSSRERLYVMSGNRREFKIDVFDRQGSRLKPVEMSYENLTLTDELKGEWQEWFKKDPRFRSVPPGLWERFYFPGKLPAIRGIAVAMTGKGDQVLVQTYRIREQRGEFYLFSGSGELIKQLYLPLPTMDMVKLNHQQRFTFFDSTYYYLVENVETETWELHAQPGVIVK